MGGGVVGGISLKSITCPRLSACFLEAISEAFLFHVVFLYVLSRTHTHTHTHTHTGWRGERGKDGEKNYTTKEVVCC